MDREWPRLVRNSVLTLRSPAPLGRKASCPSKRIRGLERWRIHLNRLFFRSRHPTGARSTHGHGLDRSRTRISHGRAFQVLATEFHPTPHPPTHDRRRKAFRRLSLYRADSGGDFARWIVCDHAFYLVFFVRTETPNSNRPLGLFQDPIWDSGLLGGLSNVFERSVDFKTLAESNENGCRVDRHPIKFLKYSAKTSLTFSRSRPFL